MKKPKLIMFKDFNVVQLYLTDDEYDIINSIRHPHPLVSKGIIASFDETLFSIMEGANIHTREGDIITDPFLAALTHHQMLCSFQVMERDKDWIDSNNILLIPTQLVDLLTIKVNEAREIHPLDGKIFDNLGDKLSDLIELGSQDYDQIVSSNGLVSSNGND
jgi:hypothetical protein